MAFIFFPHLKKKRRKTTTTKIKMRNGKTRRVHVVNCSPGPSKSLACTHFLFAGTIHAFSRIALVRSRSGPADAFLASFFFILLLLLSLPSFSSHPISISILFFGHFLEFSIYIHFHLDLFLILFHTCAYIMYNFVDRLYVFNIFLSYYYDTQYS